MDTGLYNLTREDGKNELMPTHTNRSGRKGRSDFDELHGLWLANQQL
jgi:hypothetical protein